MIVRLILGLGLLLLFALLLTVFGGTPIQFVMKDRYALGEPIEIKIRNNGNESYLYDLYLDCPHLKFYGAMGPSRIHANTHCDQIHTEEIRPRQEVVLWTWNQHHCIAADNYVYCYQSCPGRYGIVETFYREGQGGETIAERTFVIVGGDDEATLTAATPGHPPLSPSRNCRQPTQENMPSCEGLFKGISVQGETLRFDRERIEVNGTATTLCLNFNNGSRVNDHNWVLVKAGTKDDVALR